MVLNFSSSAVLSGVLKGGCAYRAQLAGEVGQPLDRVNPVGHPHACEAANVRPDPVRSARYFWRCWSGEGLFALVRNPRRALDAATPLVERRNTGAMPPTDGVEVLAEHQAVLLD